MRQDRPPERRSKASSPQRGPYAGLYDRPVEGRLVRRSDGLILQRCNSKRSGRWPYYLQDVSAGRFVSSVFTDHPEPEFECDGVRYSIVRLDGGGFEVCFLRDVDRKGAA